MQRRMAFRNERKLYPSTCTKTDKPIITIFDPASHYVVYDRDTWWQDDWSALEFGQNYDWNTPFFTQWRELFKRVPHPAVFNNKCTNSAYCNHVGDMNNCYLVFATWTAENVSYSHQVQRCRDSFDISAGSESELVYEIIGGDRLYNVQFAQDCAQVRNSQLLYDCRNVHDCFGCTNLRNKSFCLFNEQLDEATYRQKVAALDTGSYTQLQSLKQQLADLKLKALHRFAHTIDSAGSTGENIVGVSNSQYIFDGKKDIADCRYLANALQLTDSRDGYGIGAHADQLYEGVDFGVDGSHLAFGVVVWGGRDVFYSYNCNNCTDCFGCIGLRNAHYCILNKQYTKEEYEQLLPKIIQQMNDQPYVDTKGRIYRYGEFFPTELSPFAYNETVAQEHFPLTQSEVMAEGWRWKVDDTTDKTYTIIAEQLPDHIKDTNDDITQQVIQCLHKGQCNQQCTQVYKLLPKEFEYLQTRNIALPRLCSNCRHFERLAQKLPNNLWPGHCSRCSAPFMTPYAPDRPETIYCAQCYQAEVT
ncbi:MAG: hypothetical protein ACD_41C00242G0003 [uncultured bacterium]|nr:MAG: hypothetical protein ACD_41C00242G0003 [uncultured bacterium]